MKNNNSITNHLQWVIINDLEESEKEKIIKLSVQIILDKMKTWKKITSPEKAVEYFRILLSSEREEVFCALFLDNNQQSLAFEKLFYGTIKSVEVYPRTFIRRALQLNAAACILVHNHPSGNVTPSKEDIRFTQDIETIMNIIDITIVDHIIVSNNDAFSFAKNGLLSNQC